MSLFDTQTVACPACGTNVEFEASDSVNAERRPDLRAAIVDGTFQARACPSCGKSFRLDPLLTYIDLGNRQWILVQPAEGLERWPELEEQARRTFDLAFGDAAPRPARAVGAGIRPRIAFGWPALREKLLCADLGLDDASLEVLKCALLRSLPDSPLADDTELRLTGGDGATLRLAWLRTENETPTETLELPRSFYNDVAAEEVWESLRAELRASTFVDMQRLMVDTDADVPA
jgi:hypothetical protein